MEVVEVEVGIMVMEEQRWWRTGYGGGVVVEAVKNLTVKTW